MNVAGIIDSIRKLLWPLLVIVLILLLYPTIKKIIESRGFTVKVGDMEVSVQEASDQLRAQVEDLQKKIAEIRTQAQEKSREVVAETKEIGIEQLPIKNIMWVDDKPSNNAYEIANLRSDGYQVIQSQSTYEALGKLLSGKLSIDAVVSDMGRYEDDDFRPSAGINLIKAIRDSKINIPIFIYTTSDMAKRLRDEVIMSGGNGITGSPLEILEYIYNWGVEDNRLT